MSESPLPPNGNQPSPQENPAQQPAAAPTAPTAPAAGQATPVQGQPEEIYAQYNPQQAASPAAGYAAQAPYQGVAGQPYAHQQVAPAAPAAPTEKSPIVIGTIAQWTVLTQVLRGKTVQAFHIAHTAPKFWLAHVLVFAALIGLFYATTVARVNAAATGFADDFVDELTNGLFTSSGYSTSDYFGIDFSAWFQLFLFAGLLYAAYFFIRAFGVWLVFSVRRQNVPFSVAANTVASAYTGQLILTAALFVLVLVPSAGFVTLITIVATILYSLLSYMSELLIYTGINRAVPFAKSPLVPHTLLTAASMVVTFVAFSALGIMFVS